MIIPDAQTLVFDSGASIIHAPVAVIDAVNGSTVTVNNAGTISSLSGFGVNTDDSTLFLVNSGTISGGAVGIRSETVANLTNSGTISGTVFDGLDGANLINLTNSGTISGNFSGVDFAGSIINLSNTGTIVGTNFLGVNANGNITNLTNSGTIIGISFGAVSASGFISNLSNNGTIMGNVTGVDMAFGTVTNYGAITGQTGIRAIRGTAGDTVITNSGSITGTGGTAINLLGDGNDTLNLFFGSVIVGNIDFGNGNDGMGGTNANDIDTLNFGPGVNAVLNFADSGGPGQGNTNLQSAPEIINASASVLINGGTTLVAVDPTRFAADSAPLGSLTRTIFNGIDNAGSGPESATSTHGEGGTGTMAFGSGPSYWGSVFGGTETRDGSASLAGLDHGFGGVLTGIESGFETGTFGVAGGYSKHNINNEFGTSGLDAESVFGGVYWKQTLDMAQLNVALIGGVSNHEGTRNTGAGIARSDYDGWFISPSATLSMPFDMFDQPLIASARVSYVGLFFDGYTETGGAVPLVVDDRDVHLFNSRLQVMAPRTFFNDNGSHTHVETRAGVDLQFDAGSGDVKTLVAGTPLNFSADLDDEFAGFVGASITHTFAGEAFSITASTELQTNFSGDMSAFGQIKAALRF